MSSLKRSNSAASGTSKKVRVSTDKEAEEGVSAVVPVLGTKSSKKKKNSTRAEPKDQDELALEEAVFGTSRGSRTNVWDLAEEDTLQPDLDDDFQEQETGLERVRDENVSILCNICSLLTDEEL